MNKKSIALNVLRILLVVAVSLGSGLAGYRFYKPGKPKIDVGLHARTFVSGLYDEKYNLNLIRCIEKGNCSEGKKGISLEEVWQLLALSSQPYSLRQDYLKKKITEKGLDSSYQMNWALYEIFKRTNDFDIFDRFYENVLYEIAKLQDDAYLTGVLKKNPMEVSQFALPFGMVLEAYQDPQIVHHLEQSPTLTIISIDYVKKESQRVLEETIKSIQPSPADCWPFFLTAHAYLGTGLTKYSDRLEYFTQKEDLSHYGALMNILSCEAGYQALNGKLNVKRDDVTKAILTHYDSHMTPICNGDNSFLSYQPTKDVDPCINGVKTVPDNAWAAFLLEGKLYEVN